MTHFLLVHCAFHQRESTIALQWYPSKTVLTDTDLKTTAVYQFCGYMVSLVLLSHHVGKYTGSKGGVGVPVDDERRALQCLPLLIHRAFHTGAKHLPRTGVRVHVS
jgi:hypothetical protein